MSLQIASTAHLALEFKLLKHFFTSLHFQIQNNRQYLFHDLQERLVHPNKNWLPGSHRGAGWSAVRSGVAVDVISTDPSVSIRKISAKLYPDIKRHFDPWQQ